MQIYKFGGTSLGSAKSISTIKAIINNSEQKILVLSANGKTTDDYVSLVDALKNKDFDRAFMQMDKLYNYYFKLTDELFKTQHALSEVQHYIHVSLLEIKKLFDYPISREIENQIIAFGELISTKLCSLYFAEAGIRNTQLHAPDIIVKKEDGQVDYERCYTNMQQALESESSNLIITQGFICRNNDGEIDNLGRGGSDYSATIFGEAARASVIQIWSDVDGFLNNDPGYVSDSYPLDHLSFDEAAELAYFGARVLHPTSLSPARRAGIPVLLKNTFNPSAKGTLISNQKKDGGIKAVAAKDGITSITIHSGRMLLAYGFLKNIFEIFEKYKTPVDMVTTSEVSVSVTIDNTKNLEEILNDLSQMGEVEFNSKQAIICVVGDKLSEKRGHVARIFSEIDHIPIGMISYGAAKNSITFLVDTENKTMALRALQNLLPTKTTNILQHA
jgi:aspartate kinase